MGFPGFYWVFLGFTGLEEDRGGIGFPFPQRHPSMDELDVLVRRRGRTTTTTTTTTTKEHEDVKAEARRNRPK